MKSFFSRTSQIHQRGSIQSFCPLFERADCTAVKPPKGKEEDRSLREVLRVH
jgi:hypothetical protein